MAKIFSRWGYLFFPTALCICCIFFFRDLTVSLIQVGLMLASTIYRKLVETDRKRWIFPSGFALSLLLSSLYYTAEMLIFPHSPRAAHRVQTACFLGALCAFFGLFIEAYSPAGKRVAEDHVLKHTAIERRR